MNTMSLIANMMVALVAIEHLYILYPTLNTLTATQTEEADYQVVYLK